MSETPSYILGGLGILAVHFFFNRADPRTFRSATTTGYSATPDRCLYDPRSGWYSLRMHDPLAFQREFFRALGPQLHLAELFESLPEVCFYAKDADNRLVKANQALIRLRGATSERELIGKSDFDLHPRHLAERYVAEDRRVMGLRRPLPNQVWLIPGEMGGMTWYLSSKTPLFGRDGRAIGVAGMFRDLRKFETEYRPYQAMDAVLRRVLENYSQPIAIPDLAASVGLSVSQFDRRFKALFGMTPREYVLRVRVDAAIHLLVTTDLSVARIALDCGFYDQSSFGKQFRKRTGVTPAEYRRRYVMSDRR
ncbi:MAG: AraC family transcriptional regulator [Planctomycetaceae bacterium]